MRLPQSWHQARATLAIAGVMAFAWLVSTVAGLDQELGIAAGFIPARVSGAIDGSGLAPVWLTPLTAGLAHDGFVHIGFDLLFLLYCGRSVEPIVGSKGLILVYVVAAYVAAAAAWFVDPLSTRVLDGGSGPISGVLGASAMLLGKYRVKVASPLLGLWLHVLWLAAAWIGLNLLIGFTFTSQGLGWGMVAAPIAGFLAGLALARPLLLLKWRGA